MLAYSFNVKLIYVIVLNLHIVSWLNLQLNLLSEAISHACELYYLAVSYDFL